MSRWTSADLERLRGAQLPLAGADGAPEPTIQRTNWKNDGRAFQRELEQTAGAYHSMRVAVFKKVDTPLRVIWIDDKERPGKKRQHVIFLPNPWLDFAGVWTARHGRALMIEAKSTATHRLPLRASHLSPEQCASLKTWRAAGAASCILWNWAGRVAIVLPEVIAAAEARGDKSLVFEGLPVVQRGEGTLVWDFLPALASLLWPAEDSEKKALTPCE